MITLNIENQLNEEIIIFDQMGKLGWETTGEELITALVFYRNTLKEMEEDNGKN